MQEIDEELVDRKGIRINWQILPPPHAFARSLTFERIFSIPPSPPFFFFDFLQMHADDHHSRNAKRAESSLFKRFASKYRLRVLRSKYGWADGCK